MEKGGWRPTTKYGNHQRPAGSTMSPGRTVCGGPKQRRLDGARNLPLEEEEEEGEGERETSENPTASDRAWEEGGVPSEELGNDTVVDEGAKRRAALKKAVEGFNVSIRSMWKNGVDAWWDIWAFCHKVGDGLRILATQAVGGETKVWECHVKGSHKCMSREDMHKEGKG